MIDTVHVFNTHKHIAAAKQFSANLHFTIWNRKKLVCLLTSLEKELRNVDVTSFENLVKYYKCSSAKTAQNLARVAVLYAQGGIFLHDSAQPMRNIRPLMNSLNTETRFVLSESNTQTLLGHLLEGDTRLKTPLLSDNVLISSRFGDTALYLLKSILQKIKDYRKYYGVRVSHNDIGHATGTHVLNVAYRVNPQKFLLLPNFVLNGQHTDKSDYRTFFTNGTTHSSVETPVVITAVIFILSILAYRKGYLAVFLFVSASLCFSLTYLSYAMHGAYVSDNARNPLPDKLFDMIPKVDAGVFFHVFDMVPALTIIILFIVALRCDSDFKRVMTAVSSGLITIWNFKISSVQLTGVPVPDLHPPYMSHSELVSQEYWKNKESGEVRGNADMMFSGHTSSTVFALLLILSLTKLRKFLVIIAILFFLAFLIALVSIRFHYSMDIMVGMIVGVLVFTVTRSWLASKRSDFFLSDFGNVFLFSIFTSVVSTAVSLFWHEKKSHVDGKNHGNFSYRASPS